MSRLTGRMGLVVGSWLLLTLAGCGGRGELAGSVTYQDRKVVSGSVLVVGSDGLPHYSGIEPDGTYRVTDLPVGEVQIAVNSPDPGASAPDAALVAGKYEGEDPPPPAPPVNRSNWFPLPERYGFPQTSGLIFELRRGPNTHDIRLK